MASMDKPFEPLGALGPWTNRPFGPLGPQAPWTNRPYVPLGRLGPWTYRPFGPSVVDPFVDGPFEDSIDTHTHTKLLNRLQG